MNIHIGSYYLPNGLRKASILSKESRKNVFWYYRGLSWFI